MDFPQLYCTDHKGIKNQVLSNIRKFLENQKKYYFNVIILLHGMPEYCALSRLPILGLKVRHIRLAMGGAHRIKERHNGLSPVGVQYKLAMGGSPRL